MFLTLEIDEGLPWTKSAPVWAEFVLVWTRYVLFRTDSGFVSKDSGIVRTTYMLENTSK